MYQELTIHTNNINILGISLLERLMEKNKLYSTNYNIDNEYLTMLKLNFRSHPLILSLPNTLFYKNLLMVSISSFFFFYLLISFCFFFRHALYMLLMILLPKFRYIQKYSKVNRYQLMAANQWNFVQCFVKRKKPIHPGDFL